MSPRSRHLLGIEPDPDPDDYDEDEDDDDGEDDEEDEDDEDGEKWYVGPSARFIQLQAGA